jgi:hypothetical protein
MPSTSNIAEQLLLEPESPQLTESIIPDEIFTGYLSNQSGGGWDDEEEEDNGPYSFDSLANVDETSMTPASLPSMSFPIRLPPPLKWHGLNVPMHAAHQIAQEMRQGEFKKALAKIVKLIASKHKVFQSGRNGLQAYRGRAIQSCLKMVVNNKWGLIDTSQCTAESQGFAEKWEGRLVHRWVHGWVKERKLPASLQGQHVKVFTLLSDPTICTKLQSYIQLNKWSMNPEKLTKFSQNKLVPEVTAQYTCCVADVEMPRGLN